MTITRVAKRRKKLYALFFSQPVGEIPGAEFGDSGEMMVDMRAFDESPFFEGCELDYDDLAQLAALSKLFRAKERAVYLLGIKDYSKKGMADKLRREFGDEAAQAAADRCEELGFIDDERFAERMAEQLINVKRVAPRQAVYLLTSKGVPRDIAEAAVSEIQADPKRQIAELIEAKYLIKLSGGDEKSINRVINALARRGFSFSDIRSVIREYSDSDELYD
jgi:regulatory protein